MTGLGTAPGSVLNMAQTRVPMMLVSADGMILDVNAAARQLFALHILAQTSTGRLLFGTTAQNARAQRVLGQLAKGGRDTARLLRCVDGDNWLIFECEALQSDDAPLILIRLREPRAFDAEAMELLSDAFNLTAAELRVAEGLFGGHSAKEIARHLDMSPHTVRSHLRAIYGKVGENGYHRTLRKILRLLS